MHIFSDLREQHEVRLEQGLDAFVVVDGLPVVPEESKGKLVKFLIKQLNKVGKVKEDGGFFMPLNDSNKTEGFVIRPTARDCAHDLVMPSSNIKHHSKLSLLPNSYTELL